MRSERRNTVYSDQLSIDLARQTKPTFLKPEKKKGPRFNINDNSRVVYSFDTDPKQDDEASGSSFSHQMSKSRKDGLPGVESAGQPLDSFESGKHIPPVGLYEEIQHKTR